MKAIATAWLLVFCTVLVLPSVQGEEVGEGNGEVRTPVGVQRLDPEVRPEEVGEFNLEELKNRTFELTRHWPLFGKAAGEGQLVIRETSGKGSLRNLRVESRAFLFRQDTKAQVPGQVTLSLAGQLPIPKGGTGTVDVQFVDIPETGNLTTQVVIASPDADGVWVIPVRVVVTDAWWGPLAATALGVLVVGFPAYLYSRRQSKRHQARNQETIDDLHGKVKSFAARVTQVEKKNRLSKAHRSLQDAHEKNRHGQMAAARAQLQAIAQDLEKFEEAEARVGADTQTQFRDVWLQAQVLFDQEHRKQPPSLENARSGADPEGSRYPDGQKAQQPSQKCLTLFGQVKELLNTDQVDRAVETLELQKYLLNGQRKLVLQRDLERAAAQLADLTQGKRETLGAKITEAWEKLATGKLDQVSGIIRNLDGDVNLNGISVDNAISGEDGLVFKNLWSYWDQSGKNSEANDFSLKDPVPGPNLFWLQIFTSLGLACATGFLAFYVGKPFGSWGQYVQAFLWGVGVYVVVQGLALLFQKSTQTEAAG